MVKTSLETILKKFKNCADLKSSLFCSSKAPILVFLVGIRCCQVNIFATSEHFKIKGCIIVA